MKVLAIFLYKRLLFYAMRCIVYLLSLLILVSFVSGAAIHGSIYDLSLQRVSDIVVEINTEPKQQFISKDGAYSFNVPVGEYEIEANYYVDNVLESRASEQISVKNEGDFVFDLILFPVVESEIASEVDDINFDDDYFKEKTNYFLIILIAIVFIVIFLIWHFAHRKKTIMQEATETKDDYYNKIFSIIRDNKRTTQKEIRKQIPLSEAKISLIITELEHKGLIEKIKKGRGNILILKK